MRPRWLPLAALLLFSVVSASAVENREVFESNCVACHGADGKAGTPQGRKLKAKDLRASTLTDAEIESRIRDGARNKSGTTVMPAFGHDLTDVQIQAAIRTAKSFRSPPAK